MRARRRARRRIAIRRRVASGAHLQMRLASRALRLRRPGVLATASSEWASLGALGAHVVLAHASEAREDDGEDAKRNASRSAEAALREACAALARHCGSSLEKTGTSLTNDDDDDDDHLFADGNDHSKRAEALVDAFALLLKKVRHAPFARVAETLVAPLVAEIARGAAAHAKRVADDSSFSDDDETSVSDDRRVTNAFVTGASALRELESCRRDRARRGHAWVLLGLARLNLLLPDGTPDPAAAAAATMEGFETTLRDETRPFLGAMAWQSAAPTVPNPPRSALVSVSNTERSLETRIDRLRVQVAPRPSPPKWHPLCREAAKFRDQLASVERVLGVARGLFFDVDFSNAKKVSASDLARARAEARAWLEAARAWEERLELSYRGYRDLTEPLRLAACEMRRGVALLLASAPDPADDADVVEALERAKGGSGSGSERDKRKKASSSVLADAAVASAARAAASAAAAHLMSYPPLALTSDRAGASAAAAVASPSAQKALSALERVASRSRESSGVEGYTLSFASAARLRVAALRAALAAAEEESAATGALSLGAWRRCSGIFASLSSLWAHARDAEAEAERDAHELFRRRVKGPTAAEALEADDEATEAIAYERAFGRHGAAFADLQNAPDAVETLGDDADVDETLQKRNAAMKRLAREAGEDVGEDDSEDDEDEDHDDETKAQTHAARLAGLLEGDLLEEVVAAHRRLLGGLRGPPAPPPPPPAGSTDPAVAAAAAADPGGWWAVSGAKPAPKKYGGTLFTPEEATRAERFERAHDAGVRSPPVRRRRRVARRDAAAATGARSARRWSARRRRDRRSPPPRTTPRRGCTSSASPIRTGIRTRTETTTPATMTCRYRRRDTTPPRTPPPTRSAPT